jgi:hypothetical protein
MPPRFLKSEDEAVLKYSVLSNQYSVRSTLYSVFFMVCLMTAALCASTRAEDRQSKPANTDAIAPKDRVIRLFDGKTLGDCYTWLKDTKREDPRKVFSVTDGMLHISGDGLGGLVTNKRYRDYHAIVEFKFGERTWQHRKDSARDSGFLVHSNGKDGGYEGCWMPSFEVQIIEGGVGDFIVVGGPDESGRKVPLTMSCTIGPDKDRAKQAIFKPDGKRQTFKSGRIDWFGRDPDWKDEKGFRGSHDVESPHGEWTRLDVFCNGPHIETFVNGTKVNEAFDVSPHEGRLQLQTELAEVFYRRWELWPIGKGPKPAAARQE